MRKHHIALCCAVLMGMCAVAAAPLTPGEALSRVRADRKAPASVTATHAESYKLAKTQNDADGIPAVYLFATPGNDGYLLLSADDAAPALLGYSDSGAPITPTSTATATLPPQLEGLMEQYGEEIAWLRSNGRTASHPVIRKDAATPKAAYSDAWLPIAPLLKENAWGQNTPYNSQTPEMDGMNCSVGCGALAAAQVMLYHKWPDRGTGIVSCTDGNGGTYSMDLKDVSFDWENMPSSLDENSSQSEIDAVSSFLKAVGYASETEYRPYSSVNYIIDVASALIHNFNYDAGISVYELMQLGLPEWNARIYENLANVGPVILRGGSKFGGDIFVCDGYSSDGLFHINWGMYGNYNGYFRLSAMDYVPEAHFLEDGGYSVDQYVILGIERPNTSKGYRQKEMSFDPIKSASFNETFTSLTISGGWFNMTPNRFGVLLGARVESDAANSQPFYIESNCRNDALATYNGWRSVTLDYDFRALPDGYSLVELQWRDPENANGWKDFLCAKSMRTTIVIDKKGSDIRLGFFSNDYLSAEILNYPSVVYNHAFNHFKVKLTNTKGYAVTSYLTPIIACDFVALNDPEPFLVYLGPGESLVKDIYFECDFESISPDSNYDFALMDNYYWTDLAMIDITLEDAAESVVSCTELEVVRDADLLDPVNIKFNATFDFETESYCGGLRWLMYYVDGDMMRFVNELHMPVILNNSNKNVSVAMSIPEEHRDKDDFVCYLYDYNFNFLGRVNFSLTNAAVEEVVADGGGVGVSYDAASGRVTAECEEGIDRVEAYSASGALLGSWRAASDDTAVSADLSAFPAGLTIVVAHSRAGETRAVKIPR